MEFGPLQCTGKVCDKFLTKSWTELVTDLLRTQIMKVCDVICVADFHDLCLRFCGELVMDFVTKLA